MSTTFKLTYDPTEAKRGFELLAQSIRAAQAAGATLPPELVSIANRMEQVETATTDAAADTNRLETEIEQLTAAARLADDRLGSYAISTQQVGNAATVAAAKVQQKASAIERTGKVVGSTREGLEKLTGAATALGNESAEVTKGMGILAGVIAAVASPIGAVVAIAASLVSIFKSLREGATGLADDMNPVDSVLLKIASTMGLISEEAARAGETLKNDLATERFAENMKRGEAAAIAFAKAVMDVGKAIDAGRQSREEDAIINAIGDPEAIADEIDRLREKMEGLANSQALSQDELEAYRERINKLEARRIALLDEQKKKEDEANAARWQRTTEDIKQEDTRHNERMDNLKEEKAAEEDIADTREKANDEATKAITDRVMAELNGIKEVNQEQQQQANGQQQAKNPYGEGQAFEAGGSNPYAAALDPLATALNSGFGESIGGTDGGAGGVGGPSRRKQINDLSKQIYEEGFKAKGFESDEEYFDSMDYDARDRRRNRARIQKNSRKMATDALADGAINEDDPQLVVTAQEKLLEKQVEEAAKRQGADEKQIAVLQDMVKVMERQRAHSEQQEQKIASLAQAMKQLLGGMPQFRGGNPRRMGG